MLYSRKRVANWQILAGLFVLLVANSGVFAQCPKRCRGNDFENGLLCSFAADCSSGRCEALPQCIHMEWRPSTQNVVPGEIMEVGLYAVSSSGFNQLIQGIQVILNWDPTKLELMDVIDVCRTCSDSSLNPGVDCTDSSQCIGGVCGNPDQCHVCPSNTYAWFSSGFLIDCGTDALNAPCSGPVPNNDGDALFVAIPQVSCDGGDPIPALATPAGLLITTFQFNVISTGGLTTLDIIPEFGSFSRTRILGGTAGGDEVLGVVDPTATIDVVPNCLPPTAASVGCRYLSITPDAGVDPIALLVEGDAADPDVSCVSQYVQADGTLGSTAVYQTPAQWGTVSVRGENIIPSSNYTVRQDCGNPQGTVLSTLVPTRTWKWADVNNDTRSDIADILRVVDGFLGLFYKPASPCVDDSQCQDPEVNGPFFRCNTIEGFCVSGTIESLDLLNSDPVLFGCTADTAVDISDVLEAVDAFLGFGYPCAAICP